MQRAASAGVIQTVPRRWRKKHAGIADSACLVNMLRLGNQLLHQERDVADVVLQGFRAAFPRLTQGAAVLFWQRMRKMICGALPGQFV